MKCSFRGLSLTKKSIKLKEFTFLTGGKQFIQVIIAQRTFQLIRKLIMLDLNKELIIM